MASKTLAAKTSSSVIMDLQSLMLRRAIAGVLNPNHEASVDGLVEIIKATPNPELAVAILFGDYVAPILEPVVMNSDNRICTLLEFNPWRTEVVYAYEVPQTKHIYISRGQDKTVININNYEQYSTGYGGDNISFSLPTGKMDKQTSTMDLTKWIACTPVVQPENNFEMAA